jgi:hypothetical protein
LGFGDFICPGLDAFCFDLFGQPAVTADQVMVVRIGAGTV